MTTPTKLSFPEQRLTMRFPDNAITDAEGPVSLTFETDADTVEAPPLSPVGYRMLVKPREAMRQSAGGILLPDDTRRSEQILCNVGRVVAQGGSCYEHPRFNGERWCEVGDWIMFPRYSGTVVEVRRKDGEIEAYRILNDNEVVAVIPDPDAVVNYVA